MRSYAVVWSGEEHTGSGGLVVRDDRFELCGRDEHVSILFSELDGASIGRRRPDRLRGLPTLVLRARDGASLRVASLEGAGVLYELAQHVERAGLKVVA